MTVTGELRRRFTRGAGGPMSWVNVDLETCDPCRHRRVATPDDSLERMSLGSSDRALCELYDLGMLDLDGVVYVGADGRAGRCRSPGRGAPGWHAAAPS